MAKQTEGTGSVNWETVLLNTNSTLTIQADPVMLEQVLTMCTLQDIRCEIRREPITDAERGMDMEKATVGFKNISRLLKSRMINQLKGLSGKVDMQWNDF